MHVHEPLHVAHRRVRTDDEQANCVSDYEKKKGHKAQNLLSLAQVLSPLRDAPGPVSASLLENQRENPGTDNKKYDIEGHE